MNLTDLKNGVVDETAVNDNRNQVGADAGCPNCVNCEADELVWDLHGETVTCALCGHVYKPDCDAPPAKAFKPCPNVECGNEDITLLGRDPDTGVVTCIACGESYFDADEPEPQP